MRTHEKSSGNVFTDLGLPNSEQELLKAKLTVSRARALHRKTCASPPALPPDSVAHPARTRSPWSAASMIYRRRVISALAAPQGLLARCKMDGERIALRRIPVALWLTPGRR
jgi:hypothetical protein